MRTYYFDRDVRLGEFKDAGLTIVDNRLRAADFGEMPFIIKRGESFVLVEKYRPSDDGNIENYIVDRVSGKGFGGDTLTKISEMGIKITSE